MIKILENSIDFSKLGNHTKEELKSEVKRAVILQESKSPLTTKTDERTY